MFKRNDYALFVVYIVFLVLFCFQVVASLSVGIWLMTKTTENEKFWIGVGFIVIFGGWLVSYLGWIINRLILSFLCDIKLIRNGLYGNSNKELEVFFKFAKKEHIKKNKVNLSKESVIAICIAATGMLLLLINIILLVVLY